MLIHGATARGFDLVEFRDMYGKECSIQKAQLLQILQRFVETGDIAEEA